MPRNVSVRAQYNNSLGSFSDLSVRDLSDSSLDVSTLPAIASFLPEDSAALPSLSLPTHSRSSNPAPLSNLSALSLFSSNSASADLETSKSSEFASNAQLSTTPASTFSSASIACSSLPGPSIMSAPLLALPLPSQLRSRSSKSPSPKQVCGYPNLFFQPEHFMQSPRDDGAGVPWPEDLLVSYKPIGAPLFLKQRLCNSMHHTTQVFSAMEHMAASLSE